MPVTDHPKSDQPTRPHLDGSHILLTGATGFLGQAALEKLLSSYPETRVSLLIRSRGSQPGSGRLAGLVRKPVFERWRERVGAEKVDRVVAERVTVIDGDLDATSNVALPGDLDVVIHGASTVSFDPPIDEAFRTNVEGVASLYGALARSGSDPHVVHISTAYVAGVRKGVVNESPLTHDVDWPAEAAAAAAARAEVEAASRRPEVLRKAMATARGEHGKAGPQRVAQAAEDARRAWVTKRLVDYGRMRAQSLGWPDVYTLTKALGERVAEQRWAAAGRRLSIVRPAIVESALRHPYPGWIDGFKMADPLIIAYGRGILPEFPGLPDSVLDLIPVDFVVNATLAAAATRPEPAQPAYFHVSSGARNPLPFRAMYEHVHAYFHRHPMPDSERGHIEAPSWRFPGTSQVMRMLRTGERAVDLAERALLRMPASDRTRGWMGTVHQRQQELEVLRTYADLYQSYTQAEVIYDDSRTYALHQALPPDRKGAHGFDAGEIDWEHYLQGVHFPGVTAVMRSFSARRRSRTGADTVTLPERDDVAAVFDLEGTVVASNAVEHYLWARLASLPRSQWSGEIVDLVRSLPRYLRAERRDRGDFIRTFMRRYEGVDEVELRRLVDEVLSDALLQRTMPEAVRRIRHHREAGHRTVLITGTIDVLVEPLAPLFDEIVAGRMHSRDGVWTGYLATPPLVDEARAAWLGRYASSTGIDLSRSYAYGDSHSDRPWLEMVGNPQAVNPDAHLYRHAKRKHWRIHSWGEHTQGRLEALLDSVGTEVRL
ncbi:MAG: HAD-IB family hydrolase [Jiangellaceae bacterium]